MTYHVPDFQSWQSVYARSVERSVKGVRMAEETPAIERICRSAASAVSKGLRRLPDALSSGLLYTLLFATIILLFGTQHTMIISPLVIIFRGKRGKMFETSVIPRMIATLLMLNVLAYVATLNLAFCLALNIVVPFLLIMVQASQFNPKAYFAYVMAFVFLELRPLPFEQFLVQLTVTTYSAAVLAAILLVMRWRAGRTNDPEGDLASSLETLAGLLDRLAEGANAQEVEQELTDLERAFDRLCFGSRNLLRKPDRMALRYYLYATLFQRAIYLVDDSSWQRSAQGDTDRTCLHDVAAMIRQVKVAHTPQERAALRRCLQMLLDMVELPEGRIRIFFRSLLHILMIIVSDRPTRHRGLIPPVEPLGRVARRFAAGLNTDTYEFRFAVRLSIVMALTCSISLLWGFNHVYWLPLNAFLLLMPSYEESSHRMKTRPLGTAIGCIVSFLVVQGLPEPIEIYVFCMVMITFVYACSPGSWIQAIWSTSFALTMCSLTMPETTAMALRLLFVCLAAIIVLAVNRLVLPSTRERIYEANRRQLFEINRSYWDFVLMSIDHHVEIRRSADMLSDFHLVYEEAYGYAQELEDDTGRHRECTRLVTYWHMFSEVEQVEYLVQAGELSESDLNILRRIAERLHEKVVPQPVGCLAVDLTDDIESEDLRYALEHYIENSFTLRSLAQGSV